MGCLRKKNRSARAPGRRVSGYAWEYDLLGQVIAETLVDTGGTIYRHTTFAYDCEGNQIVVVDGGVATLTEYDFLGRVTCKTDPLGYVTHIQYENGALFEGRPCLKVTTTDPMGIPTVTYQDQAGRIFYQKRADIETFFTYDLNGNLTSQTCSTYRFERRYGSCSRLEALVDPVGTTQFFYDQWGQLERIVKPSGKEIIHTYDGAGRLATVVGEGFAYKYTYDLNGNLLSDGVIERCYDLLGRVIEEQLPTFKMRYTYDPIGRRTQLALQDGSHVKSTYKGAYLHTLSRSSYTHTYDSFNLQGQPLQQTLPWKLGQIVQTYDLMQRCLTIEAPHYRNTETQFDGNGNLLSYTADEKTIKFFYDTRNQLVQEGGTTYAYDALHNRLSCNGVAYTTNGCNQVISDGERSYTYDADGCLVQAGDVTYTYDAYDRLVGIQKKDLKVTFTYDSFHRRLSKTTETPGWFWPVEEKTYYLYDGQLEIGSVDLYGTVREFRLLGIGHGAEIGATVAIELDGQVFVPIHDRMGSIVRVLDWWGRVKESNQYSSFGVREGTSSISNPWRFMGKREDVESGLVYFGRRYYDPHLGRWLTPDPKGYSQGPNLYAYVWNRPLSLRDLWGLRPDPSERDMMHPDRPRHGPRGIRRGKPQPDQRNVAKVRPEPNIQGTRNEPPSQHIICFFFNGINNTQEQAREQAERIADHYGVQVRHGSNPSWGLPEDIGRAMLVRLGMEHPGVQAAITDILQQVEHVRESVILHMTGFSEGCMVAIQVIEQLPQEWRDRTIFDAIAPPKLAHKDLCRECTNYVVMTDFVAALSGWFIMGNKQYNIKAYHGEGSLVPFYHQFFGRPL